MKIKIRKADKKKHLYMILENISIVLMVLFSFFQFVLPSNVSDICMIVIFLIGALFVLINIREYQRVDLTELIWMIFYIYIFLTTFGSATFLRSLKSLITQIMLFVGVMALARTRNGLANKYTNMVVWVGMFHLIGVVVQLFVPQILYNWKLMFYSSEQIGTLLRNERAGAYTGFTPTTGDLSFIISIFLIVVISNLIYSTDKKNKWVILTLVGVVALLLTQKRGLVLGVILAVGIILFMHFNYKEKNIFKIMPYVLLAIFLLILAVILIPDVTKIIEKFATGSLSGREEHYAEAIRLFLLSPIVGNGYATFSALSSVDGVNTAHNEYLRVLCESGIIGLCLYVLALVYTLIHTLKAYRRVLQLKQCSCKTQALLAFASATQIFSITYAMSGNPLSSKHQLLVYFVAIAVYKLVSSMQDSRGDK